MKKIIYIFIAILALASVAYASDSQIWGETRIQNILGYSKEGSSHLGTLFTMLQSKYFPLIFLAILIGIPAVFFLHYKIIGPKEFSHSKKKYYIFNLYNRVIHLIAAISFLVIVPTGFVIIFGDFFGGGTFVRMAKNLHGIFTIPFALVVIPMFIMWIKDMLLHQDDIKWLMIAGGYLSKDKTPVPAGKFNAGQKTWYWLATFGGMAMILTGAAMFFLDFNVETIMSTTKLSQIDLLRIMAIIHNVIGFAIVILFFVHLYMSIFAIKGAVNSMITGFKEEEEVKILHSSWYKKLKSQEKAQKL